MFTKISKNLNGPFKKSENHWFICIIFLFILFRECIPIFFLVKFMYLCHRLKRHKRIVFTGVRFVHLILSVPFGYTIGVSFIGLLIVGCGKRTFCEQN